MEALQYFSYITGLEANTTKLNLFLVGINDAARDEFLQITRFTIGTFLIRYVDVPLSLNK